MKTGSKTRQPVPLIKRLCNSLAGTRLSTFACQLIYVHNGIPLRLADGLKPLTLNAMAQDHGCAQSIRSPRHREKLVYLPIAAVGERVQNREKGRTWGTVVVGGASRDAEAAKHARASD